MPNHKVLLVSPLHVPVSPSSQSCNSCDISMGGSIVACPVDGSGHVCILDRPHWVYYALDGFSAFPLPSEKFH